MEIKITIVQAGKETLSNEFSNIQDACNYLEGMLPVEDGAPVAEAETTSETTGTESAE